MAPTDSATLLSKRRPWYWLVGGLLLANSLGLGLTLLVVWPPALHSVRRALPGAVYGLILFPVLLLAIYYKTKPGRYVRDHSATYRWYLLVFGAGCWLYACYAYWHALNGG